MPPSRPVKLTLKLTRHADHDPLAICRPALGYGLCEVLKPADGGELNRETRPAQAGQDDHA